MNNFDLKNYLSKNVLLEQDGKLDDILVSRKEILKTLSATDDKNLWNFTSFHSPLGFEQKMFLMDNWDKIAKGEVNKIPTNWLKDNYPGLHELTDKKLFGGLKNEKELEKEVVRIHNEFFDFIFNQTGKKLGKGKSQYKLGGAEETISSVGDLIQGAAEESGESPTDIKGAYDRAKESISNFMDRAKEMWSGVTDGESEPTSDIASGGNPIIDRLIALFGIGTVLGLYRFIRISRSATTKWVNSQNDAMAAKKEADNLWREVGARQDHYKERQNVNDRIGRFLKWFDTTIANYIRKKKKNQNESLLFESVESFGQDLDKINGDIFKKSASLFLFHPVAVFNFIADWFNGALDNNILPAGKNLVKALPKSKKAQEINNLIQKSANLKLSVPSPVSEQLEENAISNLWNKVVNTSKQTLNKLFGKTDDSALKNYISKIREFFENFTNYYDSKITDMIDNLEPSGWAKWVAYISVAAWIIIGGAVIHAIKVIDKMTKQRGTAPYERERASEARRHINMWKRFGRFVNWWNDDSDQSEFKENQQYSLVKLVLEEEQSNTPSEEGILDSLFSLTSYFGTDTDAIVSFTNDIAKLGVKYALNMVSLNAKEDAPTNFFDGLKAATIKLQSAVGDKSKATEFLNKLP